MAKLHPTLWRTCRILSGKTRLQLFRRVIATPDQSVTALAKQLDISVPRTSQELRRLQSRGLLQAVRRNQNVLYRPVPDALVSTAAPLLAAMQQTFQHYPESRDDETARIATGLAHTRRLVLMRLLLVSPMDEQTLEDLSGIKRDALLRHLKLLEQAGRGFLSPTGTVPARPFGWRAKTEGSSEQGGGQLIQRHCALLAGGHILNRRHPLLQFLIAPNDRPSCRRFIGGAHL